MHNLERVILLPRRRPYPTRRSPAHKPGNRTSRAAAADQLVWSPWPLRPAVRDHKGRDPLPLPQLHWLLHIAKQETAATLYNCIRVSPYLNQRHEGLCVCIQSWANSGHHAAP